MGPILSPYHIVETEKFSNGSLRQITHSQVLFDKGDLKLKTWIGGGCEYIIELEKLRLYINSNEHFFFICP